SDDGISFYAIAQIPARNSGIKEQYDTKDHAAIHGIAYYRLRLIDIDGKENRSRIVSVKVINTDNVLSILVNPVHNKIILAASNQLNGSFNYRINGSNGQLVQQGKLTVQNGGQYIIPLNGNPGSGLYILEVSIYQQRFFYKFIVQ
ncbi:MAG: T9SS type A sorting domain-containing protein, partial [Flavisolibacter sp.]|nr:T9SS type A sorting domain-containing protein [Flavisolibacter sp.]